MPADRDKLNKQVQERISNLSDEDLLRMLDGNPGDYTPLAWEAAGQEIFKRGGREAVCVRLAEKDLEETQVEPVPAYTGEGLRCDVYNVRDYAGFWKRVIADSIDGTILAIAFALLRLLGEDLGGILGLILLATYHLGFKSARGTTPGYKILGIRVVSIDGADVSINQIAIRQISSVFSGGPCGLGFLWIALDANKQSWHDKIAGTYVINAKAEPVGAIGLPRTRVVRVGLFATMLVLVSLFTVGSYIAVKTISHELTGSEAYQLSEEYLKGNSWIQHAVGTTTEFDLVGSSISPGSRTFTIRVSGDIGEVIARIRLERIAEGWVVKEAGYAIGENDYLDITKPLVRK